MRIRIHFRTALSILLFTALWLLFYFFLAERMGPSFVAGIIALLVYIGFLIPFLYITLEMPLIRILQALKNEDAAPLHRLRASTDRFGLLAELVTRSFDQKERLNDEIAERKKTEIKLADREKQYRDLFETAPDAIVCTDRNGTVILSNPQTLVLFGCKDASPIT